MNGTGFLIWVLSDIARYLTPEDLADLCHDMDVQWISIKVANGEYPYNQVNHTDDLLIDYITELQSSDIEVGGWVYSYPYPPARPAVECELYERRIYDLGLEHLLFDVECEWKKPNLQLQIKGITSLETSVPAGLCSYRFPALHPNIDWKSWLSRPALSFVAPQVYWELAHNVESQLRKSYSQYRALTKKPYIPIGASYGRGKWEPTTKDLTTFIETANKLDCPAWGFYSLDYCLKHNREDWLSAIAGHNVELPE